MSQSQKPAWLEQPRVAPASVAVRPVMSRPANVVTGSPKLPADGLAGAPNRSLALAESDGRRFSESKLPANLGAVNEANFSAAVSSTDAVSPQSRNATAGLTGRAIADGRVRPAAFSTPPLRSGQPKSQDQGGSIAPDRLSAGRGQSPQERLPQDPQGRVPQDPAVQDIPPGRPFELPDWIQEAVNSQTPTEFGADLGSRDLDAELARQLDLAAVVDSAVQYYPLIQETIALRQIAGGDQLAALGAFDTKLKGAALTGAVGFYENTRGSLSAEQPLWNGGSTYGGYRIGRGDIQPWYQERLTNEGGELAVGFELPLIRNRTIDDRRAELLKNEQDVLAVEPLIRQQSLEIALFAAEAYWSWLAANAKLGIQQELLEIATSRTVQIERTIELQDRPPTDRVDNSRLIATRQTSLINAQRRVESAAIKLSMFYRNAAGSPILIGASLPDVEFSELDLSQLSTFEQDRQFALENRPELQYLVNQAERLRIELQQAGNIGLPELNLVMDASKDAGAPSSDKRDKSQFELESGLLGYWEPQQRKMLGKQQAVRGKLTQLQFKRQLVGDKITAELQDARSALNAATRKYQQTQANAELARQTAEIFRRRFDEGDVDLIILNIYEEAEAAARSDVIDAKAEYRVAQALYQIAQGELPQ